MIPKMAMTVVRGFCMGAADIVPGVSGGTIALVFGIYERLIGSVRLGARALGSIVKGDIAGFRSNLAAVDWGFLLPLGAGILTAIVALSSVIERLLQERPEDMAGLFFGLVLGSVVVTWSMFNVRSPANLAVLGLVAVAAFVLLGLQSGPVADPSMPAYFGAGAIAICAMILPGISGSFLLLMMGMYAAVLGAVHDRDLAVLAVFGVGAIIGLAIFSTTLGWLLDRHHDRLLAALIGLLLGSLRVLWPWPNGVGLLGDDEVESVSGTGLDLPESDQILGPIGLALVAFVLVIAISRLAPSHSHESTTPSPVG